MEQSNKLKQAVQEQKQKSWQNRLKSKAAWVSIIALILFILKNYGLLEGIGLTEESYKEFTALLLAVFTAFGVFNNPTDPDNF